MGPVCVFLLSFILTADAASPLKMVEKQDYCFPVPYSGTALDISVPFPYHFKLSTDMSYSNSYLNGTVFQTGKVLDMTKAADGACLTTGTFSAEGQTGKLALRSYRSGAFKSWDMCYDAGDSPTMPESCDGAKLWASYKDD